MFSKVKKANVLSFLLIFLTMGIWGACISSKAGATDTARYEFFKAERSYSNLCKSPEKQKYRDNWLLCINKFQAVYRDNPSGPWAAAGLYKSGDLYIELYKRSLKESDKKEALDIFKRITNQFPKSQYRYKAAKAISRLTPNKTAEKTIPLPKCPIKKARFTKNKKTLPQKKSALKEIPRTARPNPDKTAIVSDLRFWSNPNYTRIVIDANNETTYTHRLLKRDPSIKKPQRLYVDLNHSILSNNIKKAIPVNDDLMRYVRAGQYTKDSVRVVIDIKSFNNYKIFSLKNPFRIVIDVWGETETLAHTKKSRQKTFKNTKITSSAIAKQFALGVKRIVIDPGHGGRDCGALGYLNGIYEKEVALEISKKLASKIRKELQCEVIMTRKEDRFLTLEERTAIANTKDADLFISIHTNAARNRKAMGLETYFLNLATDDDAILVAARENATSTKNISDLQAILNDLMQNAKINESSRLATYVQESLFNHMKRKYGEIKNKGVKQAPFYVLLGAHMPAILVETSFISNKKECKRLINSKYQDRLCEGIINGIKKYIIETNPTAFLNTSPPRGGKG